MSVILLILGIILFISLVVVHEWGHFIAAKRSGVEVEEFGIGFPPRAKILSKKSGTVYTLNWLPLGGFVKLKGEHDSDTTPGSFGATSTKNKIIIMLAGVVMNLVTAFVLLTFLALVGMPKLIDNQFRVAGNTKTIKQEVLVGFVEPNSPASKTVRLVGTDFASDKNPVDSLKSQDRIISLRDVAKDDSNGDPTVVINSAQDLMNFTRANGSVPILITIIRGGKNQVLYTELRSDKEVEASKKTNDPKGYLGVAPTEFTLERSTWGAPIVAAGLMKQFTILTFQGLGSAVANLARGNTSAASAQVSGPVGIFVILKNGSLLGYQFVLMIVAIISLTLAIMNVLPIPALDGGRLFVTLVYRTLKKPLKQSTEEKIHGAGFVVLMILIVLITIVDFRRNF